MFKSRKQERIAANDAMRAEAARVRARKLADQQREREEAAIAEQRELFARASETAASAGTEDDAYAALREFCTRRSNALSFQSPPIFDSALHTVIRGTKHAQLRWEVAAALAPRTGPSMADLFDVLFPDVLERLSGRTKTESGNGFLIARHVLDRIAPSWHTAEGFQPAAFRALAAALEGEDIRCAKLAFEVLCSREPNWDANPHELEGLIDSLLKLFHRCEGEQLFLEIGEMLMRAHVDRTDEPLLLTVETEVTWRNVPGSEDPTFAAKLAKAGKDECAALVLALQKDLRASSAAVPQLTRPAVWGEKLPQLSNLEQLNTVLRLANEVVDCGKIDDFATFVLSVFLNTLRCAPRHLVTQSREEIAALCGALANGTEARDSAARHMARDLLYELDFLGPPQDGVARKVEHAISTKDLETVVGLGAQGVPGLVKLTFWMRPEWCDVEFVHTALWRILRAHGQYLPAATLRQLTRIEDYDSHDPDRRGCVAFGHVRDLAHEHLLHRR